MTKHRGIQALMRLKDWEHVHFPISNSLVAQRILIYLMDTWNEGVPKSIKVLTSELPFSAAAIRLQLRRLEREGWISIEQGKADSRQRFLGISAQSCKLMQDYEKQIGRMKLSK
jgi:DNA-binding MarR family transcriptional regulator